MCLYKSDINNNPIHMMVSVLIKNLSKSISFELVLLHVAKVKMGILMKLKEEKDIYLVNNTQVRL